MQRVLKQRRLPRQQPRPYKREVEAVAGEKEEVKPEIVGTFPAQRFFDTLALILSKRENVSITVKVTQKEAGTEAAAV